MNPSEFSWRDLKDLVQRTAKSFSSKLVVVSLFFSMITLILHFHYSAKHNELSMEILNARADIFYSEAGKPVDSQVRSVVWNAKGDPCDFISPSQGFVFLKLDYGCAPQLQISNAIKAGLDGVMFWVPEGKSLNLFGYYDIQILEIDIDLSTVIDKTPFYTAPKWMNDSVVEIIVIEMITNLILSFVSGLIVFVLGWIAVAFHGYYKHRQLRILDALIRWCLILLDVEFRSYAPRLYSVPFPEYRISKGDLEDFGHPKDDLEGGTKGLCFNDCCSVCLYDFEENDLVRSLPCKHVFHSKCIDPWVLNHKRLCPVCKSDVVSSVNQTRVV
jgi:hypothetical protein